MRPPRTAYFRTGLVFSMMAKLAIILLGFTALAVQSAVIKSEDTLLKRVARSPCHSCGDDGPRGPPGFPPPPPPPPFFHTQNWSGFERGSDGQPRGVFSGSAASAVGSAQTPGQAFSVALASSDVDGQGNDQLNSGRSGYSGDQSSGAGSSRNFEQQSSSHEFSSHRSGGHKEGYSSNNGGNSQQSSGSSGNSVGFGRGDQHQSQGGRFSASEAQSSSQGGSGGSAPVLSGPPSASNGQVSNSARGGYSSGYSQQQQVEAGHGGNSRGRYNSNYESQGSFGNGQLSQGSQSGYNSQGGSASGSNQQSYDDAQSALNTAQGLASQGLQTAGQTGCSKCGKSNYARSDAKSNSGNAIAVSIGRK